MEERIIMSREAVRRLKESVSEFLGAISVRPEQDYGESLELTVSLSRAGQETKPTAKSRIWTSTAEVGGIPVNMSMRLKAGDSQKLGALDRLMPFAEKFSESLDALNVSDSMELFLNLYEAGQTEEAPEADDDTDETDDTEGPETEAETDDDVEDIDADDADAGDAKKRAISRVWRGTSGISRTLFSLSVRLAEDERKKYIGRKFEAIHRSRELAVQFLYSLDVRPEQDFAQALEAFLSIDEVAQDDEPEVKDRCRKVASQVWDRKDEIDGVLWRVVTGWRPERITSVDRTILRLMMLEGFVVKALPVKSAITEAISLARSFGTDNSPRFVNGVMHKAAEYFAGGDDGSSAVIQ